MPPVAKTWMPARCAAQAVVATVVAPSSLRATTIGRSRRLTLRTFGAVARCSICAAAQPDDDLARDDADRGRRRAALAHDLLQPQRQPQVVRVGQAVGDDGGFEGYKPCWISGQISLRRR